jgi:hypothetical protein
MKQNRIASGLVIFMNVRDIPEYNKSHSIYDFYFFMNHGKVYIA